LRQKLSHYRLCSEKKDTWAMPRIFVSYRHTDSKDISSRIADRLKQTFGEENVFFDDKIEPGEDWARVLEERATWCDVMLVVIGRGWINSFNEHLHEEDDWVRMEIEWGLTNKRTRIIPVLVKDAPFPSKKQLPQSIKELYWRNAETIGEGRRFDSDVERLIKSLKKQYSPSCVERFIRSLKRYCLPPYSPGHVVVILLVALVGAMLAFRLGVLSLDSEESRLLPTATRDLLKTQPSSETPLTPVFTLTSIATPTTPLTPMPVPTAALFTYDFETGTDGWQVAFGEGWAAGQGVSQSTAVAHSGQSSLQFQVAFTGRISAQNVEEAGIYIPLSQGTDGTVCPLLSAWVYLPPEARDFSAQIYLRTGSELIWSDSSRQAIDDFKPVAGQWNELRVDLRQMDQPLILNDIRQLGIKFLTSTTRFSGSFYIDDITCAS
jgi:hypothetical protein